MPNYDRTGPQEQGPMTGRGLGPCGCGFRIGFGRGLGRRLWFRQNAQPIQLSKEDEKKILQEELKDLQEEKNAVEKRLKEI